MDQERDDPELEQVLEAQAFLACAPGRVLGLFVGEVPVGDGAGAPDEGRGRLPGVGGVQIVFLVVVVVGQEMMPESGAVAPSISRRSESGGPAAYLCERLGDAPGLSADYIAMSWVSGNVLPLDVQSLGADLCNCEFDQEGAWVVAGDHLCGGFVREVYRYVALITSAVVSFVRYTDTSPWGPPWRKTLLMGLWFPSASWVTSAGRTLRMTVRSAAKGWKLLTDWWTLVVYSCSASISLFPKVSSSAVVI